MNKLLIILLCTSVYVSSCNTREDTYVIKLNNCQYEIHKDTLCEILNDNPHIPKVEPDESLCTMIGMGGEKAVLDEVFVSLELTRNPKLREICKATSSQFYTVAIIIINIIMLCGLVWWLCKHRYSKGKKGIKKEDVEPPSGLDNPILNGTLSDTSVLDDSTVEYAIGVLLSRDDNYQDAINKLSEHMDRLKYFVSRKMISDKIAIKERFRIAKELSLLAQRKSNTDYF